MDAPEPTDGTNLTLSLCCLGASWLPSARPEDQLFRLWDFPVASLGEF